MAFLGSSEAACLRTTVALQEVFPFAGRGYWSWADLLAETQPDVVDICVPNHLHFPCALAALEAGCHALCEKPLVWYPGQPGPSWVGEGQRLIELARQRRLAIGICTQYAASLPHYLRLYQASRGSLERVESFSAEMETLARGRLRTPTEVWADMGPHPLSLLLSWLPDGTIAPGSLQVRLMGHEARAAFDFVTPDARCAAELTVRDIESGRPVRRFGVNGFIVDCSGRAEPDGAFRCVLTHEGREEIGEDFMSLLIGQFHRAASSAHGEQPLVPGEIGLRNLELQMEILRAAQG